MAMLQRKAGNAAVAGLVAARSNPAGSADVGAVDLARAADEAAPVLPVQRSGGDPARNALIAGRMRFPGEQAVTDIDRALRELRRDEPAADVVEKGLKAAKSVGVPVDLEGIRPPASALAVTTTGFGPGNVPAKKAVPPPKKVPAVSPLGRAGAKKAAPVGPSTGAGRGKAGSEAEGAGARGGRRRTRGGGGAAAAAGAAERRTP